ncbi:hypothetical protein V8D89_005356 [Ganoderma adspersum]
MFSLKFLVLTAAFAVSAAASPAKGPHPDYVTTITETFNGHTTTEVWTIDAPYTTTTVFTVSGTPTTVTTIIQPFPTS